MAALSTDGGRGWKESPVPGLTDCTGGTGDAASDPWLSVGSDGTAYLSALVLVERAGPVQTQVVVSRSGNGGQSWSLPVAVTPLTAAFPDKPIVTADPLRPHVAYTVWSESPGSRVRTVAFSRTTDGGASWSLPVVVHRAAPGRLDLFPQVSVQPDGELVIVFVTRGGIERKRPVLDHQWAVRSADGGVRWSAPTFIGRERTLLPADPARATPIRAEPTLFSLAQSGQRLVLATAQIDSRRSSRIFLTEGGQDGSRWGPRRVILRVRGQAFLPSLAIGAQGGLAVTWYQAAVTRRRRGPLTTVVRLASPGTPGGRWHAVTLGPAFDLRRASVGAHLFLGDYQGLAPVPGGFGALTVRTRASPLHRDPTDVFFQAVRTVRSGLAPRPG